MPAYTGWNNNPFWNPTSNYGGWKPGGVEQDWYNTPDSELQSYDKERGEYERFLTEQGFGAFDRRGEWGRGQYNRAQSGYEAAELSNPNLSFREYLNSLEGTMNDTYAGLSALARGDNTPGQTRRILWG